jgi:hypothetical protein
MPNVFGKSQWETIINVSVKVDTPVNFVNTVSNESKFLNDFFVFVDLELCATNPCQNSGYCIVDDDSSQSCICSTGYVGSNCETVNCLAKYILIFCP